MLILVKRLSSFSDLQLNGVEKPHTACVISSKRLSSFSYLQINNIQEGDEIDFFFLTIGPTLLIDLPKKKYSKIQSPNQKLFRIKFD